MNITWYLFPLAAVISLVYSASRFEYPPRIIRRALRLFIHIIVVMAIAMAILFLLSYGL